MWPGARGPQGPAGATGATGATGPQGPAGSSAGPDVTDSFTLTGFGASNAGCYVTLTPGHSYVVRFEVTARLSTGNVYFAEVTAGAFCDGAGSSLDNQVITRQLYTDEIEVLISFNQVGHTNDIWAVVTSPSGTKHVTIKAFIEYDEAF